MAGEHSGPEPGRAEGADRGRARGAAVPGLPRRRRRPADLQLSDEVERVTVGRGSSTDISLEWDTEVSRLHAELDRIGADWTVSDDGLSRNGTHVNGERVVGRRRLRDRDVMRFGQTPAVYREPLTVDVTETEVASEVLDRASLSEAQRRVLVALCRPFKDATGLCHAGDEPADRRRAVPQRRRGQDAPAGAVREVRNRGSTAEPEADPARRAGAQERRRHAAGPLSGASPHPRLLPFAGRCNERRPTPK